MKKSGILALAVLTLAGHACNAQERAAAGWYLGAGVGGSRTSFSNVDFTLSQAGTSETKVTSKAASKIFSGYDFTRNWGIEGAYASLGSPEYRYSGATGGQDRYKATSWSLAGKGTLPLATQFNVFAKLGVTDNKSNSSTATVGVTRLNQSSSKSRADVFAGIGAAYNINTNISVRLEFESYGKFGNQVTQNVAVPVTGETGRASITIWSVGMAYKF